MRRLLGLSLAVLAAACTTTPERAPPEVVRSLAPSGKLRLAVNVANPALARRDDQGEVTGITVDLGRRLAARLGAEAVIATYPNPGKLIEGARKGEWDVGFAAIDPTRGDFLAFTLPYMEVSLSYAVPPASSIATIADVDRPGVKIGVGERNAADLFLTRSLRQAQLVRVPDNLARAVELLRTGAVDAFATNREGLLGIQEQLPGYRIVPGRFHVVQHAIVLPKAKEAALGYVNGFLADSKANGSVAESIARHRLRGIDVAP